MVQRAEPELITKLAERVGLPHYFVEVTDTYPPLPYVLFSDPHAPGRAVDLSLAGLPAGVQDYLFVTVVDSSPGNVYGTREQVRQSLNPGSAGVQVELEAETVFIKREHEASTPVQVDTSTTVTESGVYPALAVDVYRVHYTGG